MEKIGKHPHDNRALPLTHRRSLFGKYHGRGIYLITVCTENRKPLLGTLCGETPEEAFEEPTSLGKEVLQCWDAIPEIQKRFAAAKSERTGKVCCREIKLLARQLMPNHPGPLFAIPIGKPSAKSPESSAKPSMPLPRS